MANAKEKESKLGLMDPTIMENGNKIKPMVKASLKDKMEVHIKGIFKMIYFMVMAYMLQKTTN